MPKVSIKQSESNIIMLSSLKPGQLFNFGMSSSAHNFARMKIPGGYISLEDGKYYSESNSPIHVFPAGTTVTLTQE